MPQSPSKFSVFAGKHIDLLNRVYESGGVGEFETGTTWATGSRLFHEAQKTGHQMAVLFGDTSGNSTGKVLYYAFLTGVEVSEGGRTFYSFEGLTPIDGTMSQSDLKKRSDDSPLRDAFQRDYSIVYTPNFLYPQ